MMPRFRPYLLLLLPVLLTACSSPQKRIKQNQAAFDAFPRDTQNRIRAGEIAVGDSRAMVRIAKGEPTYITVRETQDSEIEVWRWTRSQQYIYSQPVHFNGRGVPSPQIIDVAQLREFEVLRVEFLDDKAVVVEELQE